MGYSDVVLQDSPVGFWRLGETSGALVDSIHGNNGTANGTPTRGVAGLQKGDPTGNGIQLNNNPFGSGNDYVTIANASVLNPGAAMTIEGWFKLTTSSPATNQYPLLQKAYTSHTPPYYLYGLFCNNNTAGHSPNTMIQFAAACGGTFAATNGYDLGHTWANGEVHYLAGVYDGAHLFTYVDGAQVDSIAATGAITSVTTPLDFGRYTNLANSTGTPYWQGVIDEVALYSSALSATRIKAHYLEGLRGGVVL